MDPVTNPGQLEFFDSEPLIMSPANELPAYETSPDGLPMFGDGDGVWIGSGGENPAAFQGGGLETGADLDPVSDPLDSQSERDGVVPGASFEDSLSDEPTEPPAVPEIPSFSVSTAEPVSSPPPAADCQAPCSDVVHMRDLMAYNAATGTVKRAFE